MSGGILQYLTEAQDVKGFVGCDFDTALEIVYAAHEYNTALNAAIEESNVIPFKRKH
jgi:hypothetical protein